MQAHLTQQQLDAWDAGGDMPPDELLRVSQHLKDCTECSRRLRQHDGRISRAVAGLDAQLRETPEEHLSFEQLQGLVDRALDDVEEEIVMAHVADCAVCAAEVEDLRSLAAVRPYVLPREREAPPRPESTNPRPRLLAHGGRRRQPFLRYAVAALLLLVAGIGWWALRRPAAPRLQPPIAHSNVPVGSPSRPLIVLHDAGGDVVLDQSGGVRGVPSSMARAIATALQTGAVAAPAVVVSLRSAVPELRGGGVRTLVTVSPAGVVVDDRPRFVWRGAGATSEITVFNEQGATVAASGTVHGGEWTPPRPLPRGVTLVWQVASGGAIAPAADAPQARFRIADAAAIGRIGEARASGSHLALATAYAEAGLRREAEGELRALQTLNPGSPVAGSLLRSLSSWPR